MKNRLILSLLALIALAAYSIAETPKDVTREVRKLRAEASYQELKGNYEQSLKLYEESLKLMPDEKVEAKIVLIKEKLGIVQPVAEEPTAEGPAEPSETLTDHTEASPAEATQLPDVPALPPEPAPGIDALPEPIESPVVEPEPVVEPIAAPVPEPEVIAEPNPEPSIAPEAVLEPEPVATPPEEPVVVEPSPGMEMVPEPVATPEVSPAEPMATPEPAATPDSPDALMNVPATTRFTPVNMQTERVVRSIGTAYRKKANRVKASTDFETLLWDQEEEIDGQEVHNLYVNGVQLELPVTLTYVGFPQITSAHDFVVNVDVLAKEDEPNEALLVNGALIGNYEDVSYPELSADRSTWAAALIERSQDEVTGNYDYASTLLVNGKVRAGVPHEIEKIRLSPNGARVAFCAQIAGNAEMPRHDMLFVEGDPTGPKVETLYDIKWDSMGENVFWSADTLRDEQGDQYRILVKNAEVLSNYAMSSDNLYLSPNSTAYAFQEHPQDGYYLVTEQNRSGPWEQMDDVVFSPDGRLSFVATQNGITRIYIDGEAVGPEIIEWYGVRDLVWSPDGKHWAADAKVSENVKAILLDGKQVASGITAGGHVFSPDSKRLASWVRNESKEYAIVVDGQQGPWLARYETDAPILFSPDSKHVFYWSVSDDKQLKLYRDHEMVPSEGDIAPNLYFDDAGAVWYYEVVGSDPGEFLLKKLD